MHINARPETTRNNYKTDADALPRPPSLHPVEPSTLICLSDCGTSQIAPAGPSRRKSQRRPRPARRHWLPRPHPRRHLQLPAYCNFSSAGKSGCTIHSCNAFPAATIGSVHYGSSTRPHIVRVDRTFVTQLAIQAQVSWLTFRCVSRSPTPSEYPVMKSR